MSVTSIEAIKASLCKEVELPSFDGETPFVVKLKRPSMLDLAESGKIPNQLLESAYSLFMGESKSTAKEEVGSLPKLNEIMKIIARTAMVEPKYDDLVEAGIDLTDDQKMAIFNYTQAGVKALKSFR